MSEGGAFLVTGGAGFIGSHLVAALVERAERVRVLDDLSTGRRANLDPLLGKIELTVGDIRDAETARRAMRGVRYVLHHAALPSVPRSIRDPETTLDVNVTGTLRVLEAARAAGVERVVFAASSSAYGDTDELPKVETMPVQPLSPYAASKMAGEGLMRAYSASMGLACVSLRYFNVFGPRQDPTSQYSAVIPRFVTAALRGEAPVIFGDGLQSRDFCPVRNVVDANLAACRAPDAPGRVLNVACGERRTLLELLEAIGRHLGRRIVPRHVEPRPGDVRHSLADVTKARRILGWDPRVSVDRALAEVIEWYRNRLDDCAPDRVTEDPPEVQP